MELQCMPALFAGQEQSAWLEGGGAMLAVLQQVVLCFPRPRAIVCVSAHWQTQGIRISIGPGQECLHAPASVATRVARRIAGLLDMPGARFDSSHPLDAAVAQLVQALYPQAEIPVVQISLDSALSAPEHAALATWLKPLRRQGILVLGVGTIGLDGEADAGQQQRFRARVAQLIDAGDLLRLAECHPPGCGEAPADGLPACVLPLLYTLAVRDAADRVELLDVPPQGHTPAMSVLLRPVD